MLSDVFGDIGLLKCDPVKIELKTDCEPYSLTTPRCIPFPLLPKVEAELRRMLALGIIEEVTGPSDWCAPMVPVEKKNKEQVRVCVDLKRLNKAVKRERFILPTLEDIAPKLVGAKVFNPRRFLRILADPLGCCQPKADNLHYPDGEILLPTSAIRYHVGSGNLPETNVDAVKGS